MNYEEFVSYYEKYGKTPNQLQKPKNPLNDRQLKSKYHKYVKSLEKKEEATERYSTDESWDQVKHLALVRDGNKCQAMPWIPAKLYDQVKRELQGSLAMLDPCHVFRKGAYPYLKYDVDNIVILHRLFHTRMDQYQNPFTGKSISYAETYEYWTKFIGFDRMQILKQKIQDHQYREI